MPFHADTSPPYAGQYGGRRTDLTDGAVAPGTAQYRGVGDAGLCSIADRTAPPHRLTSPKPSFAQGLTAQVSTF
ncbi:hypothetical protein CF54_14560 [Streptomyces sp. Tu 6176]|nr:hypothetical protein CF54_14560 [Streptomyces sp. Tu 6176]